jgi:hypothetical protein
MLVAKLQISFYFSYYLVKIFYLCIFPPIRGDTPERSEWQYPGISREGKSLLEGRSGDGKSRLPASLTLMCYEFYSLQK